MDVARNYSVKIINQHQERLILLKFMVIISKSSKDNSCKADNTYKSFLGSNLKIRKSENLEDYNTYAIEWNEKKLFGYLMVENIKLKQKIF